MQSLTLDDLTPRALAPTAAIITAVTGRIVTLYQPDGLEDSENRDL